MGDRIDLDALAGELTPVRPLSPLAPALLAIALAAGGTALVAQQLGLRTATMGTPMFLLRTAILLLLATAGVAAVAGMARPGIGRDRRGWRLAAAAAMLVPLAAGVAAIASRSPLAARIHAGDGMNCLGWSIGMGIVFGAALVLWLRRGAPVSPERAGTATGLAAGSLGTLSFSLHCPHDDIVYFGLWYTLAIGITTIAGRLFVPRLIRW